MRGMSSFVFVGGPMDGQCIYHQSEPPIIRTAERPTIPFSSMMTWDPVTSVRPAIIEHEYQLDSLGTRDFKMTFYRHRDLGADECYKKIINHLANGILQEGPKRAA